MSIRLRLTLAFSSLLVASLLVFGVTVASVLHWVLTDSIDRTLEETVRGVVENIRPEPRLTELGLPTIVFALPNLDVFRASSVFVQIWGADGRLTYQSGNMNYPTPLDPEALSASVETRRNVSIGGAPVRVLTHPVQVAPTGRILGHIQAGISLETTLEAQSRVTVIMIVIGLVALGLSAALGGALLGRALRPVESIAAAASQIATGDDLSRRIPYDGPPDELGQLTSIFNATLARLEKLFTAQRRFVADVSHELRTPLTVIQANVDLIRRYGADPDSLEAIGSESKRMARLVNDLLLLAQADAGELPLDLQDVELDTVVLEVFNQARLLDEAGARLALGRFEPVRVRGDNDRLKQLLLNLISNALKYTPPEGTVRLDVWAEGGEAVMQVADTGEGIPPEDLPHIFDRFYRVDKARARKHGGAGLGLSIAHWIAQAHGGRIAVESTVGVGTTFIVRLPRAIPTADSVRETRPALRIPRRLRPGGEGAEH